MIIETQTNEVSGMEQFESEEFAFDPNSIGIGLDAFFKNLYKDPIYAIIRELCSNAQDAHRDARNFSNFKVQLPNRFDTNFVVTDNGTGISHNDMMNMYRMAFASDKRSTNELTGGMGLGSKSPYAYTDSFHVTSRYNGEERNYLCGRNERDIPTISAVGGVKPCGRNGFSVRIPVQDKDWRKFEEAFNKVLLGYVHTDIQPEAMDREGTMAGVEEMYPRVKDIDDFFSDGDTGYRSGKSIYARQGSCVYDIKHLMDTDSFVFQSGIIDFPIGTLKFTPSRDEILDNEKNRDAVNLAAKAISDKAKRIADAALAREDFTLKSFDSETGLGKLIVRRFMDEHKSRIVNMFPRPKREWGLPDPLKLARFDRIYVAGPDARNHNVRFESAREHNYNIKMVRLEDNYDIDNYMDTLYRLVGKDHVSDIMEIEYVRPKREKKEKSPFEAARNSKELPVYSRNWDRQRELPATDYVWLEVDQIRQSNSVVHGRKKGLTMTVQQAENILSLAEDVSGERFGKLLYVNTKNKGLLDSERNLFKVLAPVWKSDEYRKGWLPRRLYVEGCNDTYHYRTHNIVSVLGRIKLIGQPAGTVSHYSTAETDYQFESFDPRNKASRAIARRELDRLQRRYPLLFKDRVSETDMINYYIAGQKNARLKRRIPAHLERLSAAIVVGYGRVAALLCHDGPSGHARVA